MPTDTVDRGAHTVQGWELSHPQSAIDGLDVVGPRWLAEECGFYLARAVFHED